MTYVHMSCCRSEVDTTSHSYRQLARTHPCHKYLGSDRCRMYTDVLDLQHKYAHQSMQWGESITDQFTRRNNQESSYIYLL